MAALAAMNKDFSVWRPLGSSRNVALNTPPITSTASEALAKLFAKGRNRKDVGGDVIEDLGFRISVWNGRSPQLAASLMIGCGMYSNVDGLSNAVVLSLPTSVDTNSSELMTKLMASLVEPWEPEWAAVCSSAARNARQEQGPFLHKALYLRSDVPVAPDLPSDVVTRCLGQGRLFLPAQAS